MIDTSGTSLSQILNDTSKLGEGLVEVLESSLADGETVLARLFSTGALVHETGDETVERGGGDDGLLFVVTDRKLVFVLDTPTGREVAEIPYTDLRDIEVDSGFLSTKVAVTVWGRGTFRFKYKDGDDPADTVEFVESASDTWQRTVAALQDARQYVTEVGTAIKAGQSEKVADARESTIESIDKARRHKNAGVDALTDPLETRIADVEQEFERTRMESRFKRGQKLASQTTPVSKTGDYDRTHQDLLGAREQFEKSLRIADTEGFWSAPDAEAEIDELDRRLSKLEVQPIQLAEQALERALDSSAPATAADRWENAFERYRDVLEAGWGTTANFDGETDTLRYQLAWLVAKIVTLHEHVARRQETAGDEVSREDETAQHHYNEACKHVSRAREYAREYRPGDPDQLDDWLESLQAKRASVSDE